MTRHVVSPFIQTTIHKFEIQLEKAWSGQHQVETALREEIARLRDVIANNVDPKIVSFLFGLLIIKNSQRIYAGINI